MKIKDAIIGKMERMGSYDYEIDPNAEELSRMTNEEIVRRARLREAQANDPVNYPEHYKSGEIECIDAIEAALTPEEFRGYLKGNVFKYTWRERLKGGDESMAKARWYINRLLQDDDA